MYLVLHGSEIIIIMPLYDFSCIFHVVAEIAS